MTRLVHRSTQLQEFRALLAQFSKIHAELQQISSHGCHLRSKFVMIEELRTQDAESALADIRQVVHDMELNGKHLSSLVAAEAALQQRLHSLRRDS